MRQTPALAVLVLVSLGMGLLPTPIAHGAGCDFKYSPEAVGSTCEGELGWSYDPATRNFGYGSVIASAKTDDPYEYREDFACGANTTQPGAGIACSRAFDCPVRLDPDGEPMSATRVATFRRLKADPQDPWQTTHTGVCRYTGRTIPMGDALAAARERIEKQVGRPKIIAQPPGGVTLVNFTSLFHAPEQNRTSLTITKPVPGEISATPEYTWDLGDGITADGPGHPYDQGTDPKSPASDDYYVKAVYSSPGEKQVRLTLTWRASITLAGSGAIPLDPIVFTTETTTTAKTATARLYAR